MVGGVEGVVVVVVMVGVVVVVWLLSCFSGLDVTAGKLGFRTDNLSVCFKLFRLSTQETGKRQLSDPPG